MTGRVAPADEFARDWTFSHLIAPGMRLLSYYFRATASGVDGIPRDRPVIYVGKHPRTYLYFETMVLGLYAFWDSGRPPIRVLEQTGTALHRVPVLAGLRRRLHPIPATAASALKTLEGGQSILIFPGGTRELYGPRDRLQWDGRTGFARLAIRTGTPVVPFAIAGADRQHPWRVPIPGGSLWLPPFPLPVALDVRFGAPMMPPSTRGPGAAAAFAADVEAATRGLLCARRSVARPGLAVGRGIGEAQSTRAVSIATSQAAATVTRQSAPVVFDPRRWRYRFGCVRLASWLSRYHRVRTIGTPARGPCIYVSHHGAGYLSGDLAIAVYHLSWREWLEGGGAFQPLRVGATFGHAIERAIPGLAWLKRTAGLIEPSEASCLAALERGEQLLLTPGGRRESSPSARDYRLQWNDRYGFVRLARRTGVPIVPLAVVGGYEAYPGFAAGRLSLWSPVPLPARIDIAIGDPIPVERRPEDAHDVAALKAVQQMVRDRTQALYDELLSTRRRQAP